MVQKNNVPLQRKNGERKGAANPKASNGGVLKIAN